MARIVCPFRESPLQLFISACRSSRSISRKGAVRKSEGKSYGAVTDVEAARSDGVNTGNGSNSGAPRSNANIERLQADVNEVKGILKQNVEKVIERGEKVDDLSYRAGNLSITSTQFKKSATELKEQTRRRSWKLTACIVCVVVVILAIVTLVVLYFLKVI